MKLTKFDIEYYRRQVFHLMDTYATEQGFQLFRSAHFIDRLNLRAEHQKEALRLFPYAIKRAHACENGKKISINLEGHLYLIRCEADNHPNRTFDRVMHCMTYAYSAPGQHAKHFDADIKVTFVKKT